MTSCDAGKSSLSAISPPGLSLFWKATEFFMRRPNFPMQIRELNNENDIIPIITNELEIYPVPIYNECGVTELICYICKTPSLPGKFNIVKAQELGIPKGPLYAILKSGKSVTLPDGRIVHSNEVVGESDKSRYFAIIGSLDGSNDQTIHNFCNHPSFNQ